MNKKSLGIMKNTLLSVTALVVMNGVQQLLIYPYLTRQMGAAAFGDILVVLGIIAIIAPALGQAVNNSRIVAQQKYECSNGDADTTILLFLIPGTAVGVWFCRSYFSSAAGLVLAALLLVFTALKNYSDVQYRLTLNYNRYFFYYLSISLGYVIGALTYNFIHSWVITLLIGEVCGFLFVTITGTIYRQPLHRTANFQRFFKDSLILFASYLLYNGVLNLDRVLLKYLMNSETVTVFYVASLIGKMIAMLVGPLNSIAISYLCKRERPLDRKAFGAMIAAALGVGLVFYFGTCIVTPVFAKIAYPQIAEQVCAYAPLANLSQILCFVGSFLLTVVLTLTGNRWQMIVQSFYAVAFLVCSVLFCHLWGFGGFIAGILLANLLRLVFTITIGLHFAGKNQKAGV